MLPSRPPWSTPSWACRASWRHSWVLPDPDMPAIWGKKRGKGVCVCEKGGGSDDQRDRQRKVGGWGWPSVGRRRRRRQRGMGKGKGITHTSLTPRGRTPPPKARSITGHPKERRRPSTPSNNSSAVLHVAPPFKAGIILSIVKTLFAIPWNCVHSRPHRDSAHTASVSLRTSAAQVFAHRKTSKLSRRRSTASHTYLIPTIIVH